MAKNKSPKILTKKHLARQERERRQTRMITAIAIGIIAVVVLGIAYGLLNDTLFLKWRPAVTVNGESLSLHDYQVRVRVTRQQLVSQYMQYSQLAQMFGIDPNSDSEMSQSLTQIAQELDSPSSVGSQVIDDMIDDLLIRQYARKNGITVTEADIEKSAQEALRYYPDGTPTPTITPTELVYPTLNATQLAIMTPTLTSTPTETQTPAPTSTPIPTPTPDLVSTATPIPTITPTATPYTLDGYKNQYQDTLSRYAVLGLNNAEFRYIYFETGLYRERVQSKVTADIAHEQEQVWARHILVADEETAKDVSSQLRAGGDFGALAIQYSIDTGSKDKGGDLGWFARGKMVAEFEKVVFSMNVGQISPPVKSIYGYHIIQLMGHEIRPLTEEEYQAAVTAAFSTWLESQRSASTVVINNSYTKYTPESPTIAEALAEEAATSTAYVATYQAENGTE